ncbi:DUF1146 family protein [Apilactobacillus xinyiensis]|uniref:DUF1146 family protein n=1 Tax=Apilactobacillus xinyiensis TaxID=2841032 RepID=UPI001C7D0222|nr:DUF1146 family protein [Apilactobacillus xinyiensis]MCL0311575.1 DUF1146 family protein [Apilactobacillus xinyiensis]
MLYSNLKIILNIVCYLFFIFISFWCIVDLHLERFLRMHKQQFQTLVVILSVALGYLCASFFITLLYEIHDLFSQF